MASDRWWQSMFAGALLVAAFTLSVPFVSLAAGIPAGFPAQPLWLSKENVTANETVTIFTVLYNESEKTVGGNLVFTVDNQRIASLTFSLDAGKSSIQSAQWKATA